MMMDMPRDEAAVSTLSDTFVRIVGEVEAKQWDGSVAKALDIFDWLKSYNVPARLLETNETANRESPEIVIQTPEGNKHVRANDWIVNLDGVWLLFSAGSFRRQYEKKEE